MAETRISDVIVPEVFADYIIKRTEERALMLQSAAIMRDPKLPSFLTGGGQTINMPGWNPLGQTESNVSGDDPAVLAVPDKIGSHRDIAIRNNRNNSWRTMDLAGQLAGDDPMRAIGDQVMDYWDLDIQKLLINQLNGVIADNIANDASDMVVNVATDAVGTPTAAELISAEAIIDTMQTMGDTQQDLAMIIMHSVQLTTLNKLNLIDFIPDSRGEILLPTGGTRQRAMVPTYLGMPVIVNDQLSAIAGVNRVTYTAYLFAAGALGWGESPALVPVETDRVPLAGSGGGQDTLTTRRQFVVHPMGISFTAAATIAGESPTNAEYALAASWDRVYPERKQVKMAFLQTNG